MRKNMLKYKQLETDLAKALRNVELDDLPSLFDARRDYAEARARNGFKALVGELLTDETGNEKLAKGDGVRLFMLALAPHTTSSIGNLCPFSTPSCRDSCVAFSGNGGFPAVLRARRARVEFLVSNPASFLRVLVDILDKAVAKSDIAVRLNGFSDIRWERVLPDWFWARYSDVKFYDYTKHSMASRPKLPKNYSLTYSVTEKSTNSEILKAKSAGRSIAVVVPVRGGKLRTTGVLRPLPFTGMIDGDINDRRFNDPAGSVVALRMKGSLRPEDGLVIPVERLERLLV